MASKCTFGVSSYGAPPHGTSGGSSLWGGGFCVGPFGPKEEAVVLLLTCTYSKWAIAGEDLPIGAAPVWLGGILEKDCQAPGNSGEKNKSQELTESVSKIQASTLATLFKAKRA